MVKVLAAMIEMCELKLKSENMLTARSEIWFKR